MLFSLVLVVEIQIGSYSMFSKRNAEAHKYALILFIWNLCRFACRNVSKMLEFVVSLCSMISNPRASWKKCCDILFFMLIFSFHIWNVPFLLVRNFFLMKWVRLHNIKITSDSAFELNVLLLIGAALLIIHELGCIGKQLQCCTPYF